MDKTAPISPRGHQATDNVNVDASNTNRGVDQKVITQGLQGKATYEFIDKLWHAKENQGVIEKFLNNKLCNECATNKNPKLALDWYRTYAIQDYFYLVDYVKFKALRLTTIPQNDIDTLGIEAKSVASSFGYVLDWLKVCKESLGIKQDRIDDEERSVAELAYANYLQNNAGIDDWFNLHVIMIACTYGWSKLALQLYNDKSTQKGTAFFDTWIIPSINLESGTATLSKSADKLSVFLDKNSGMWAAGIDLGKWNSLFRTSLRLEVALFDSAFSPYGKRL